MNIRPDVLACLSLVGCSVFYFYPDDYKALPCISYFQEKSEGLVFADDTEYLSRVVVGVDVWGEGSAEVSSISATARKAMENGGFSFLSAEDIGSGDLPVHRKMRFVKII